MPNDTADSCRPRITQFYEVHCWPHRGRVLLINQEPWRDEPILTWVRIGAATGGRTDATVIVAHALAAAASFQVEEPLLVVHDARGNMLASPAGLGFPVTRLRHVATPA